jgi:hypothetical protein
MRALVVYESMFGNTRKIAETIAVGIGEQLSVHLTEVSRAPSELDPDTDLVVVGGPTHDHGMTTAATRSTAASRRPEPLVSRGIGIREWLAALRPTGRQTAAAAFDTRVNAPMVFSGSAARDYAPLLEAAGFQLIAPTESFRVGLKAQEDGLVPGEVDRAGVWGRGLASQIRPRITKPVVPRDGPRLGQSIDPEPAGEAVRDHKLWVPVPDSSELQHGIGRRRV